tara:strand:- start:158 stop:838 length:681 start_codon:yes stop_codon:yes gene_type:complete
MLALKLGQSLSSSKNSAWLPTDESSLVAWYRKASELDLEPSPGVKTWGNSEGDSTLRMGQSTVSEQPTFANGVVTFDPANTQNLQTTGQISLTGSFMVGMKINPSTYAGVILGDNTSVGEFFKLTSNDTIRVKIDSSQVDLTLDSGTWDSDIPIIIARAGTTLVLFYNGVLQSTTGGIISGTADIDTIGVRRVDLNPYDGTITEIQIYNDYDVNMIAKINTRLSPL